MLYLTELTSLVLTVLISIINGGENPIKIQPDKLVVEFGASASADCYITTTHHGMGWEASQGAVDMVDDVQSLTWKVESLIHWDIKPFCYVLTDDQWQLELQVTVYKRPDLVSISTVNHPGPMIEGRQYELQCDVQNVAPVRFLNVNWYKGQQLVHTDSFTDETKTPVNETRTLQVSTQRGDDGVQYRCEAELKLGPEGPQPPPRVTSDPLTITVHSPPFAGNNLIKIQPDKLVVEFGTSASANCSITTTHHGMGWEASQGAVDLVDDVQSLTWKVETLTHWDIKPFCAVITDDQWQLELQVTVYKRPDLVSISTVNHTGPMIEGRQYELQCDVQNVAPVHLLNVNWYKGQQLVQTDSFTDETKTPVSKTMTLQVSTQRGDDGVQYRCETELKLGPEGPQPPPKMTSYPLTITVHYAPKIEPDKEVVKLKNGSKVSLSCTAKGNPEPELNWSVQSQIKATGRQQTTLTIFQVSLADAGVYTCTAINPLGDDTRKVSLIVEGGNPIKIQPDKLVVEFGASASADCYITHHGMGWEASQGAVDMVDDVQSLTWKVESLIHWDIKPFCYVLTDQQLQLKLHVTVYKLPDLVSISTVYYTGPMIEGRQYELQCDVQNVAPVRFLNVNWYKGQQLVQTDSFTDETKTPVSKTMTLQVSTQRGDDGVQYRCEAELKLGPEGLQPPPRVTSDPLTITVHSNELQEFGVNT